MYSAIKEKADKQEFADKNKSQMTFLKSQSTQNYHLYRDNETSLFYIKSMKNKKTILIGDKEQSEEFILFGLQENIKEVLNLFKNAENGTA